MINNIKALRFLTFVRNDIFPYYDTAELSLRATKGSAAIFIFLKDTMQTGLSTTCIFTITFTVHLPGISIFIDRSFRHVYSDTPSEVPDENQYRT